MNRVRLFKIIINIAALVLVIGCGFYLAGVAQDNEAVRSTAVLYGYPGVFLISLISGFNLLVPVPAAAFMPLLVESGMNFYALVLVIAIGVTSADLIAYFIGRTGREAVLIISRPNNIILKIEKLRERFRFVPYLFLFLFAAFVPLPNEILLIPFGLAGYRFFHILPIVFSGNLVFNILYSYGLINIFNHVVA